MSLNDIINVWLDENESNKKREYFTPEKVAYYFY
jgi:hypothetical protein